MKRPRKAKLTGVLRLVSEADSIGVPLLSHGNYTYVPEMDSDLRILKYLEFYNEAGYASENVMPGTGPSETYSIGDPAPIPFWVDGKLFVLPGDAQSSEPEVRFGAAALENDVLKDLTRLLDDARSGRIKQRHDRFAADAIIQRYPEVFEEVPVRSRYWVSQYRKAVEHANDLTEPPHPIDTALKNIGDRWLQRFASKTTLRLLVGILGKASNRVYTSKQIREVIFAYLLNQLFTRGYDQIDVYIQERVLHRLFPDGLWGYYVSNGFPEVPFEYARDHTFAPLVMEEIDSVRFDGHFKRAEKMVFLIYGRSNLPKQLDEYVRVVLNRQINEFKSLNEEGEELFHERRYRSEWARMAADILNVYERMLYLDAILYGDDRLGDKTTVNRFGMDRDSLNRLRQIKRDR